MKLVLSSTNMQNILVIKSKVLKYFKCKFLLLGVPSFSLYVVTKELVFNSVALSVAIAVALCSTADFLYHRSRKKTKRPEALTEQAKQRRRSEPEGRTRRSKNKKPCFVRNRVFKERRRHTLPQIAVPSAQAGLTSLFGMGRGEPRRNNHLKVVVT